MINSSPDMGSRLDIGRPVLSPVRVSSERHKYYLGVNCNLKSKAQECSSNVLQYQISKQVYSLTKHLSVTSLFRLTDSSSDIRYQVTFT